jgi:hypothetical protein
MYPEGDDFLDTAQGLKLPMCCGGELLPYDMTGLTLSEIQQQFPRFVSRYAKFLALPPTVPAPGQAPQSALETDEDEVFEDAEEDLEFYDTVEIIV